MGFDESKPREALLFRNLENSAVESLDLFNEWIYDNALEYISKMKNLKSLDISWCYEISPSGLKQIFSNDNISELDIRGINLENAGDIFPRNRGLKKISLSYCPKVIENLLLKMEGLEFIEIGSDEKEGIPEDEILLLNKLPNLKTVTFYNCYDDAAKAVLKKLDGKCKFKINYEK